MGVAQNLSRAINLGNTLRPRAISQRSASTDQQSSDRSTSADSNVVQPLEIEVVTDPSELEQQTEEDMMSQILGQYSDAEWRRLAQVCMTDSLSHLLDSWRILGIVVFCTLP